MSFIDYSSRKRGTSQAASSANSAHQPDQNENPFHDQSSNNNNNQNQEEAYNYNDQRNTVASYQQDPQGLQPGQIHDNRHFDVEVQHTEGERGTHPDEERAREFFDPTFPSYAEESELQMPFFDHVVENYGEFGFFQKLRVRWRQTISFLISLGGLGLILVAAFAVYLNPMKMFRPSLPRAKADREYERRITGERLSGRPAYYAEFWGYQCDEHEIITEGGWILKAHRISDPRRTGGPGYPVILQHGILCNSSHFILSEERSMAFWLVDQGYDVWITNIRANFKAGHTEYSRDDPRFWAWGLKELAFDLRDTVEFVIGATGFSKVAFVGHSQGSGSMYLALSPGMCPELGHKISCFVALGPSVYAGPVLRKFPFSIMRQFRSRKWWSFVFGVKEFVPAIALFQQFLPGFWFGHLAYVIFAFLFGFHDHNWALRQKPKIFRSLPVPTSSELLYWYMSGFSHRGCIFDPRITDPWFPRSFPPHSIYYGSIDYLVLGKPMVQRIQNHETNLRMVHAVELEGYEHLDMIFGIDAWRTVFPGIKDTIETTMPAGARAPEMSQRQ